MTASNLPQAMNVRASGVVVRGIGFRRFAPSVWHTGAITVEKPNATFENVHISEMATTGISIQSSGARLRQVTISYSGMLGIHGRFADDLVLDRVLARRNNIESFNIAPVSGGAKLGASRGVKVIDSNFSDNYGPGFWEDLSVYNTVVRGSNFNRNSGDGLFLELSAKAVVGDSVFMHNKLDGIKVNNTSNVKIWNNTFVGNNRSVWLAQDARRNTNRSDQAVDPRIPWPDPEMPWQLDDVTLSNNVVGLPDGSRCVLCAEDFSNKESAESMRIKLNGNVYNRTSSSAPTLLTVWSRGSTSPATFTTLAGFKSGTGQESRGREYTGSAVVSASGAAIRHSAECGELDRGRPAQRRRSRDWAASRKHSARGLVDRRWTVIIADSDADSDAHFDVRLRLQSRPPGLPRQLSRPPFQPRFPPAGSWRWMTSSGRPWAAGARLRWVATGPFLTIRLDSRWPTGRAPSSSTPVMATRRGWTRLPRPDQMCASRCRWTSRQVDLGTSST